MKLITSLLLGFLLFSSYTLAVDSEENEIDFEDPQLKERQLKEEDEPLPSWYEGIIGPDYFDDDSKQLKNKEKGHILQKVLDEEGTVLEPIAVTEKAFCAGCPSAIDPEDDKIKDIASFALSTYSDALEVGDDEPALKIVKVVKAEGQVVAGYKYILDLEIGSTNCSRSQYKADPKDCEIDTSKDTTICHFQIWEQTWINHKELLHSECEELSPDSTTLSINSESYDDDSVELLPEMKRRRKRETNAISKDSKKPENFGRVKDAEDSQEYLNEMARFAVAQLDEIDEDNNARVLVEVLNSKKQTVSGWLYHMKIRVAQTTCSEGTGATLEQCKDKITLPFNVCQIKILFQPWQVVTRKVTESQCYPEKIKKSKKIARKLFGDNIPVKYAPKMTGGSKSIDPNSKELLSLVDFAIDYVDASSNALHAQKLVKIVQAQRQIVSGVKTKLIVELGYTKCRKGPVSLNRSECEIDEERDHQFCRISVWEKPWLKEKKVTESKCGKEEEVSFAKEQKKVKRSKRALGLSSFPEIGESLPLKFSYFMDKFNKTYPTQEEYEYRLGVFKENMRKVKLLQETEQGSATYGATQFADLTEEEFSQYLGFRVDLRQRGVRKQAKIPTGVRLPKDFDWRDHNVVTPVKNQGMCGSCWAYSVTGNIEGLFAIKHKKLESFSEQELVDCDTLDQGCNGGLPENAYKFLQKLGGLETEDEYPYRGKDMKCSYNLTKDSAQVTGFVEISKDETEMAQWLFKNGPISIGINANAMQFYFGGVSHPWKFLCSPKTLDHGVLIVGFGWHTTAITKKTLPYWLVKNSWGNHWGEGGYYKVYRGDGTCGLNQMPTSAVIA